MQHVGGLHGYIMTLVSIHDHQIKHFLEICFLTLTLIPATVSSFSSTVSAGCQIKPPAMLAHSNKDSDHQKMAFFFFFFFFISPTLAASLKGAEIAS